MRDDDMLRLSLDCARLTVRGDDFAPVLAAGGDSIMRADAAAAFCTVPIGDGASNLRPRVVVSGARPSTWPTGPRSRRGGSRRRGRRRW